jgi:hypothetical protein
MRGRKIIVLLFGASAISGSACLFMARAVRCDEIVEPPVRSPDGESVATSTLKSCPVGFLSSTNYSVSVALSFQSPASSSKTETSVFESADATEVPTLTWVNGHELVLKVNDIGAVQVSKHEAGDVRISYTVPRWIWDRLGTIEADRLHSERESQDLYKAGKLSKEDLRASIGTEDVVAEEQAKFRQWVIANATVEDPPH